MKITRLVRGILELLRSSCHHVGETLPENRENMRKTEPKDADRFLIMIETPGPRPALTRPVSSLYV